MLTTLTTPFDLTGQASKWSAQAERARMAGDMREASELHAKAGKLFEDEAAKTSNPTQQTVSRFLAATQYYLGGLYADAARLCRPRKIKPERLPENIQAIYRKFEHDAHERAKPEYKQTIRDRILQHRQKGEYQQILDLLKDHQHVYENDGILASIRGNCCERIGDFGAAAVFFSDAIRKDPENHEMVLYCAAAPLRLIDQKKIDEAWTYSQELLEHGQHPVTLLAASIVRHIQAVRVKDEATRGSIREEQLKLFQEAEDGFQRMAPAARNSEAHRTLFGIGYIMAAIGWRELGDRKLANDTLDRAVALIPNAPLLRVLRGGMRFPDPSAAEDFRTAIKLGDQGYQPYTYLAMDALNRREFRAAHELSIEALRRRPPRQVEARLYGSIAIALAHLGASYGDVAKYFEQGVEIAPEDLDLRQRLLRFQASQSVEDEPTDSTWVSSGEDLMDNSSVSQEADQVISQHSRRELVLT